MAKIHTKAKRMKKIRSTTIKHRYFFTRVEGKKGAKSFVSKEAAQAWAREQGLESGKYVLHELQNGKKFQWREAPRV